LQNVLEENATVTFKQWISTDRSTLETTVKPCDECTNMLIAKLAVLQPHSFVAVQQEMYLKKLNLTHK
jgi:deoxycytidylate deaminase